MSDTRLPVPPSRPQPDEILTEDGQKRAFGYDPSFENPDVFVQEAPAAYDPKGEIAGDPGQLNPWGTGPGTGYGSGITGLNWRNIKLQGDEFQRALGRVDSFNPKPCGCYA